MNKINWLVRIKNPVFWVNIIIAIFAPILAYFGLKAQDITTWQILGQTLLNAISNPFVIVCVIVSVWNAISDPTTEGIGDSLQALTYKKPKNLLKAHNSNTVRIFISQPMKGKTDEEILAERNKAVEFIKSKFKDKDIEIIDSYIDDAPDNAPPLWYLSKSLELLAGADFAYFCKGWENYGGCRIEHECAVNYCLKIIVPEEIEGCLNVLGDK